MFYNKGVLKNFAKFTAKHLCQSLFFNKVPGLSLWNLRNFQEHLFYRTPLDNCFWKNNEYSLPWIDLIFRVIMDVLWRRTNSYSPIFFPFCYLYFVYCFYHGDLIISPSIYIHSELYIPILLTACKNISMKNVIKRVKSGKLLKNLNC